MQLSARAVSARLGRKRGVLDHRLVLPRQGAQRGGVVEVDLSRYTPPSHGEFEAKLQYVA